MVNLSQQPNNLDSEVHLDKSIDERKNPFEIESSSLLKDFFFESNALHLSWNGSAIEPYLFGGLAYILPVHGDWLECGNPVVHMALMCAVSHLTADQTLAHSIAHNLIIVH